MAIAILAQGTSLEQASERTLCSQHSLYSNRMRKEVEEQEPLFYDLPLPRLLNWNRWWHIVAKTIQLVYKKKTWSAIGSHLQLKKGIFAEGIILLRKQYSSRGLELKRIKHSSDGKLECPSL